MTEPTYTRDPAPKTRATWPEPDSEQQIGRLRCEFACGTSSYACQREEDTNAPGSAEQLEKLQQRESELRQAH